MTPSDPLPRVWTPMIAASLALSVLLTAFVVYTMVLQLVQAFDGLLFGFSLVVALMQIAVIHSVGSQIEEHLIQRRLWLLRNAPKAVDACPW